VTPICVVTSDMVQRFYNEGDPAHSESTVTVLMPGFGLMPRKEGAAKGRGGGIGSVL
jgi:hypothetical protein